MAESISVDKELYAITIYKSLLQTQYGRKATGKSVILRSFTAAKILLIGRAAKLNSKY